ncbi:alpha/beta hydrolase family protein [Parasphingopyxis marina]|uniref:Uncharacterized protein n=1 Tax=Parasphingopyxis marina TaxID=2761622 RepID=A0A842HZT6_9SPHN|nr:hypothetical protein [Parasphingopyxis marina]MBC2777933.1 hypothetical protein [Parasphingopyxis marina]
MPPAPRFRRYDWGKGQDWLTSLGPEDGRSILIVPPLFEELNRTRKLLSDLMRALAGRGIGAHLPELPGTGESETILADANWDDWKAAVAAASNVCDAGAVVAVRGGCLLDTAHQGEKTLRFAPVEGKRLIRDLVRSRSVTDKAFDAEAQKAVFVTGPTMLGGYPIGAELACAVRDAEPRSGSSVTVVRLEGDRGEADSHIAGAPLWRRAEPTGDPALSGALADNIAAWLS